MTDHIEWYRERIGDSSYEYKYNIPYYAPSFLICVVQCILITLYNGDDTKKVMSKTYKQDMITKISEHSILKNCLLIKQRISDKYDYDLSFLRELINVMEEKYNIKFKYKNVIPKISIPWTLDERELKRKIVALLWNYCPMFKVSKTDGTLELLVRERVKKSSKE